MASIKKRPDGMWRAWYRDEVGKEHARHFTRKVDAQSWLDRVTAAVVTGQYVDPKAGRLTLRTYSGRWQANQIGGDATTRIVDNALRIHILPVLGNKKLNSIRPSDVQALVKGLSAHLAPTTVRGIYDVLARIYATAVDDRAVVVSPCRRITLPRKEPGEITPPTVEEVARVVTAMPNRYRAVVIVLAGSGLRIGELLGLRVSDIDFLRKSLKVERQRLQDGRIGPVKSSSSARTVPLGQVVIDALAAHLAEYPSQEWLFLNEAGGPLTYPGWQWVWRAVRRDAKTAMGTHDLRHFFASALIAGGASVKQVQAVLGHNSAVITLGTYAHLWPGDDDKTRAVIDDTLSILRTDGGLRTQSDDDSAGRAPDSSFVSSSSS